MEMSSHSLFLLQQLNVQREFGFLCDCTVAIGNVYFKAHRAVLAAFSNYFKMIFIHQSSECIKIQPTDIQPDVFSYLLHIMYTGMGPKQQVDQSRLQEGIRFLHAYQLYRGGAEGQDPVSDTSRMSNLYGIQISSQSGPKGSLSTKEGQPSVRLRPSPTLGPKETLRNRPRTSLHGTCSVASGEDGNFQPRVKQEVLESEVTAEPQASFPGQGSFRERRRPLHCHQCGENCSSHQGLREHLFTHASGSLVLASPVAHLENTDQGLSHDASGAESEGPEERPLQSGTAVGTPSDAEQLEDAAVDPRGSQRRKAACATCLAQGSQLQEQRSVLCRRQGRCRQAAHVLQPCCEGQAQLGLQEVTAIPQDNGGSCYSLDSEISQESIDTVLTE
ncbi:zinc finger and BTB domain-containing protein 25-like [Brienomyrus brachyistius]|uniref:zinc finger and BTB domain-containing protein 25-like n=1 Tax=Brienomyrus brachyistius TaxID=42636 RepID=UPI0020B217F3|nr:zinc finger and BTB domain-containing protein 25-like [Brienomyrus brachyistius]XP_048852744.1 zinc finger and BTB domain-containing protein 25-like [Brienomyrus brachyistius]XP_048852745.1 zinc finger and BTB domain-containing protein 25-like [Brienomyrus brachyistius]